MDTSAISPYADENTVMLVAFLVMFCVLMLFVVVLRWMFRINVIVKHLQKISDETYNTRILIQNLDRK